MGSSTAARGQAQNVPAFTKDNLKPGETAASCFIVTLIWNSKTQSSPAPSPRRGPVVPRPVLAGGREGGEKGGERKGQGRTPLLLPGLCQQFGTTHRILPERSPPPVPFDLGSCTAGLRPHTLPGPRLGGQTARGTFGQENYILPACFPVIHWLPPGWTAGRKGPGCGRTSHSQLGTLFQDCVLNRLWN